MNILNINKTRVPLLLIAVVIISYFIFRWGFTPKNESGAKILNKSLLGKPVPGDFIRSTGVKNVTGAKPMECLLKIEQAKPHISHQVYVQEGKVAAEDYLFDRHSEKSLVEDMLVTQVVPWHPVWTESKLKVLDLKNLKLVLVPLFSAQNGSFRASLYESDGVARLVICDESIKGFGSSALVRDATVPSAAAQEALKQIDAEMRGKGIK